MKDSFCVNFETEQNNGHGIIIRPGGDEGGEGGVYSFQWIERENSNPKTLGSAPLVRQCEGEFLCSETGQNNGHGILIRPGGGGGGGGAYITLSG